MLAYMWFAIAGSAKATLGEYEQALPWLSKVNRRELDGLDAEAELKKLEAQ